MSTKRIKRFEPELHWKHAGNPSVRMKEKEGGQFVHHADYAKLEGRVLAFMAANGLNWDMEKVEEAYQSLSKEVECEHVWTSCGWNNKACTKCGKVSKI